MISVPSISTYMAGALIVCTATMCTMKCALVSVVSDCTREDSPNKLCVSWCKHGFTLGTRPCRSPKNHRWAGGVSLWVGTKEGTEGSAGSTTHSAISAQAALICPEAACGLSTNSNLGRVEKCSHFFEWLCLQRGRSHHRECQC